MNQFPRYPDLIGRTGIVFVAGNQAQFVPAVELADFYSRVTKESADKIAQAVGTYNSYTHYLRAEPGSKGIVLWLVNQLPEPPNEDWWENLRAFLRSPRMLHPDRTIPWFKALVGSTLVENYTMAERLTFFKLRSDEFEALEPWILDYLAFFHYVD